ncbi:hypothetical protein Hanom_Chr14g01290971 [Helianthus anomalus]
MYPHMVGDIIPYVELYFYESHNSLCAFFNPHHIKGESCTKNSEGVQSHIIDMFTFHTDKTFFVAPYLAK